MPPACPVVYQELSIAPQLDVAQNLFIGNLPMKGGLVDHKTLYAKTIWRSLKGAGSEHLAQNHRREICSVGQQQMIEIGRP